MFYADMSFNSELLGCWAVQDWALKMVVACSSETLVLQPEEHRINLTQVAVMNIEVA
jgi:hypothetical protein